MKTKKRIDRLNDRIEMYNKSIEKSRGASVSPSTQKLIKGMKKPGSLTK